MKYNLREIFKSLEKNSITISYKNSSNIAFGGSKFGGSPHLPKGFLWPYFAGKNGKDNIISRPLSFLMQINLAEVHKYDKDNLLPASGMLYFFYDCISMLWGFDPMDKGCAQVFYFDTDSVALTETKAPATIDKDAVFPELAVTFETEVSVPDFEEMLEYHFPDNDLDWEVYDTEREKCGYGIKEDDEDKSKLFGYADIVQNSMLLECELASKGYYCGGGENEPELTKEEGAAFHESSKDWVLLCQMSTVTDQKDFELMFCDCGSIYFYIRKQDLAQRNFNNIWLTLQCY